MEITAISGSDFDGIQQADENEDVYIGSYGVHSYAMFTPGLEQLLESPMKEIDLSHFYEKHGGLEATVLT